MKRGNQAHDYECGSVEEGWHTEVVVSQDALKTLTNTLACSSILSKDGVVEIDPLLK